MRITTLAFALLLAAAPAFAAQPEPAQQATVESSSTEQIKQLLAVMDMPSMMANMMQQATAAQQQMLSSAFGSELNDAQRKQMQEVMTETTAIMQKHLSWDVLEPSIIKIYGQVFTQQEVQAMTSFYSSPEGASILKKSPQAMAMTMQELQPVMVSAMQEVKAVIEKKAAPASK